MSQQQQPISIAQAINDIDIANQYLDKFAFAAKLLHNANVSEAVNAVTIINDRINALRKFMEEMSTPKKVEPEQIKPESTTTD